MTNAIIKLSDGELTAATELVLANLSTDYFKYEVVATRLRAVSQAQTNLVFRTSTDNGVTYMAGSYTYSYFIQRSSGPGNGSTAGYDGGSTRGFLLNGFSNVTNDWSAANIEIFNPMNASGYTTVITRSGGKLNADSRTDNPNVQMCVVQRLAVEANNAIRIFVDSDGGVPGDFSMRYAVYGYLA